MNIWQLGQKLYDCRRWINYRCVLVFAVRCLLYDREVKALERFLQQNFLRRQFFAAHPELFAQLTRQFFFRGSTARERLRCITDTFALLEKRLAEPAMQEAYLNEAAPLELLRIPYGDSFLSLDFFFCRGEIREGSMSLFLRLEGSPIYHINFWLNASEEDSPVLCIGCHQGSRHGLAINKALTKAFFGCRPKNLILTLLRVLAQELEMKELQAVSDYGFYANNHIRRDRKLRISYDEFWRECGGAPMEDIWFFRLPLAEQRKNIEEVPTRKRAVYRRRFAWLDALEAELRESLRQRMR